MIYETWNKKIGAVSFLLCPLLGSPAFTPLSTPPPQGASEQTKGEGDSEGVHPAVPRIARHRVRCRILNRRPSQSRAPRAHQPPRQPPNKTQHRSRIWPASAKVPPQNRLSLRTPAAHGGHSGSVQQPGPERRSFLCCSCVASGFYSLGNTKRLFASSRLSCSMLYKVSLSYSWSSLAPRLFPCDMHTYVK